MCLNYEELWKRAEKEAFRKYRWMYHGINPQSKVVKRLTLKLYLQYIAP